MRQLPLFALTVLVGLSLLYSFLAPFQGVLDRPVSTGDTPTVTTEDFELPDEMKSDGQNGTDAGKATSEEPVAPSAPSSAARKAQPGLLSPSLGDATPLQRIAPRAPLSDLGQAALPAPPPSPAPPPPPAPPVPVDDTAKSTLLYRPVATA